MTARTVPSSFNPRPASNFLEVQIALARQRLSPGSIDGILGSQTRAALRAFQTREGIPVTGEWDDQVRPRLIIAYEPTRGYQITTNDLERLSPVPPTWLGKSKKSRLDYETALELVAEKSQSHPKLIQQLNPGIVWTNLASGTTVTIPWIEAQPGAAKAATLRIRLHNRQLQAYDAHSNLLVHFPCSIAHKVEKRPVGELRVTVIVDGPNYRFDPEIYSDVPEARGISRPLMIPPGPNNPVGTVWLGLSRSGYGIHGTPRPEEVGRTESRGCFRLANWNAELLLKMAWIGLPVVVEP